jgi:UDP-glucose 4-epimerase
MVKILITGASGFVGSFLVEEALKRAYSTYAGVRKTSNLRYLSDSEISFFNCDFSDKEDIKKELAKQSPFDYIIHNAGITKTCRKEDFNTVNYQYTKNLIEAIKESKNALKKFVYISSLAAQGPGKTKTNIPVSFDDKPRPKSFYGLSKLKSENYIKSAGLDYLIFRPTGVYGPREKDYLQVFKSINKHQLYICKRPLSLNIRCHRIGYHQQKLFCFRP